MATGRRYIHVDERFDLCVHRASRAEALASLTAASTDIKSLQIWFCGLRDFDVLKRFRRLQTLQIADWPISNWKPLEKLASLKRLAIVHATKARSLEGLGQLRQIESLSIQTPISWHASGKHLIVDSLRPLSSLKRLKYLDLGVIRFRDGRLDVLAQCKALREANVAGRSSLSEIAALAVLRPDLEKAGLEPAGRADGIHCEKCNRDLWVLRGLAGTGKRAWCCRRCSSERFESHIAHFERLKAARTRRR